jgi:hypothetical protein
MDQLKGKKVRIVMELIQISNITKKISTTKKKLSDILKVFVLIAT